MLALVEHVGYGIQGMVTDAVTGKPVSAAIYVGANYPVYSDPEVGDYHKYLIPGTYSLRVEANGYTTRTIPNVAVNNLACTTIDVQMEPVASQFGYRVMATHIPAFNAQDPGDESYTAACLGSPDHVNYSLGRGGYIILDMLDTIFDGEPGTNDIAVYEGDSSPEGFTLYAGSTPDGPWINLGYATGSSSFDLQPYGVGSARYFMLLDDNNGQMNVNDAGFDFDAIACLHPAKPDTAGHLSGFVYDAFTHLPLPGVSVAWADSSVLTDVTGKYVLELTRGIEGICASLDGYRSECDTLIVIAAQADTLDFYLFPTLGTAFRESRHPNMSIEPNPFTADFKIQFYMPESGRCKFELFDLSGRKVSDFDEQYFSTGNHRIEGESVIGNISSIKPGSYILIVHTPDSLFQCKAIKAL